MNIKKTSLLLTFALFTNSVAADNPFNVNFDVTSPFMEDSDTLVFDGMRVEGAGLSASNDALKVKFDFDYNTLNFILNKNDIKIYSNIGIFNEEHMVKDVLVSQPSFTMNGSPFHFGKSYDVETTSNSPFFATLNLQAGHVISYTILNPSNDFSAELSGENVDSHTLGKASQGIVSGAHKILADGIYHLKITPSNSLTLTFNLKLYNANNSLLRRVFNNDNISISFEKNNRDYSKYKVTLRTGEKLTLSQPSNTNIRLKLINSLGKKVASVRGLALIYEAEQTDDYFLFIENSKGHGGTYQGMVSINPATLFRSKQPHHKSYDEVNVALP